MNAIQNQIRQLEEELLAPEVRRNSIRVAELLADDVQEFASSGLVFNKTQILAALKNEPLVVRTLTEFQIRELSTDVILATYLLHKDGAPHSRRSSVWKRSAGRWQMVFHQGTNLRNP